MNTFFRFFRSVPRSSRDLAGMTVVALLCATGCGGGANKPAGPTAQIKREWVEFFSASTPASKKIQLLQNGQQLAPVIRSQANSPLAAQTTAIVSKVRLQGPDRALVVYSLELGGQPVMKNVTGTAVRSGGTWRISDQSLCALLRLEGSAPPACARA